MGLNQQKKYSKIKSLAIWNDLESMIPDKMKISHPPKSKIPRLFHMTSM